VALIVPSKLIAAERKAKLVPEKETVNLSPSKSDNTPKLYYGVNEGAFMFMVKELRVWLKSGKIFCSTM